MFGKAGYRETAYLYVCLGSIGMVKAGLPEPQCPKRKPSCRTQRKDSFILGTKLAGF
jgi:hypothetical protein